jgi:hypothetical protein
VGKLAFAAGAVGSVVMALLMSGRLEHRDYSASIVNKLGTHTTCPTFWVSWDKAPDLAPDGMLGCSCPEQPKPEAGGVPMHPPQVVHDSAAPMDVMTISYTQFTSLGGTKHAGLSYTLVRGSDRQNFVISPAFDPYSSFALAAAIPLVVGTILSIILALIPGKKGAAG